MVTKDEFLRANVSEDFGISNDKLVDIIINSGDLYGGRFYNALKDDPKKIKRLLDSCKAKGMSPAYFVAKEKAEGYSAGISWLNHYGFWNSEINFGNMDQLAQADIAIDVVMQVTGNTSKQSPAWTSGDCEGLDPGREDLRKKCAEFIQSLPANSIGRSYFPMTAAACWGEFYPEFNNIGVNGCNTFGNPLEQCAASITKWGGKITGGKSETAKPGKKGNDKPIDTSGQKTAEKKDDQSAMFKKIAEAVKKAIDEIKDMLTTHYYLRNTGLYSGKTGLMFTRVNDYLTIHDKALFDKLSSINDLIQQLINARTDNDTKNEQNKDGNEQDLANSFVARLKSWLGKKVLYDENSNGRPTDGKTDNSRFISFCLESIHPSVKNMRHKDLFTTFSKNGYMIARGQWKDIKSKYQKGDILMFADHLDKDGGGKEYLVAISKEEAIEAYPYENGYVKSAPGQEAGEGIQVVKIEGRPCTGCADCAIIRVYNPKQDDAKNNPQKPVGGGNAPEKVKNAINKLHSLNGTVVGNGQCYGVSSMFTYLVTGQTLGCNVPGPWLAQSGQGNTSDAALIGAAYNWSSVGATVIQHPDANQIKPGTILNFDYSVHVVTSKDGSNFYDWGMLTAGYAGHTVVVKEVRGEDFLCFEQYGQGGGSAMHEYWIRYSGTGKQGFTTAVNFY